MINSLELEKDNIIKDVKNLLRFKENKEKMATQKYKKSF